MKKRVSVEEALIKGLKDARDYERGKKKLASWSRELPGPAPEFKSREIKALRQDVFAMTQVEFAQVLNVAVATLRSWEQGIRRPEKASNRLLQIIQERPEIVSTLKGA